MKWIYLGGDCCHDVRILSGEKGIATYDDGHGAQRSVHMDTEAATKSVDRIKSFLGKNAQVQVIIAHDTKWRESNEDKFLPGTI